MLTKDIQLVALKGFVVCCLIGCTVTKNHNESGNSIPNDWSIAVAPAHQECVSINGEYQTYGVGKFKEGDALTQARLDAVLGYTFPSEKVPEMVGFSLNRNSGLLYIQFGHPINQSFSIATSCSDGWYKSEVQMIDEYVGDGATLDYLNRNIELGKTVDEELIIRLILDGQFSSFGFIKSRDKRESWSKYKKIRSQN